MARLADGLSRAKRALPIALWLACMLAGAWVIARTPLSTDLSAFLPASPDPQQQLLLDQLQSGVVARTLLAGIEGGSAEQRAQASRKLAAALRGSGLFEQVQNGEREAWGPAGAWLFEHRYALSPAISPQRFTPDGLREAIDETLSLLGTPAGSTVKSVLERDPTGETVRIAEALIPAGAPRTEHGVWVSRQAPRALLLAVTRSPGADIDAQQAAVEFTRRAFDASRVEGLQLRLSGPGVFAIETRARIEREARNLMMAGVFVMGGLLLLAFASARAVAVALLPVATGIVAGVTAVGLGFGVVHGITLAFGSTLIGEAVDYAIYYLIQARSAAASGSGWQRWRERNWPTVRLGLLTSVCGFAALLFSGFPGLAQLGLFSIAGLGGAALATRYVLPALAPDGAPGQGFRGHLAAIASHGLQWLPRTRVLWAVLALLAAALLSARWNTLWRGDLTALSPVPQEAQQLDETLRADLGASDARTLVVAGGADLQAALRNAEAAAVALDRLVEAGALAGYDSPARLLPSLDMQRRRAAALPEADVLRRHLAAATAGAPLRAERLAPFVADIEAARRAPPIRREDLDPGMLRSLVDALLIERGGGAWSALLPLQPGAAGLDAGRIGQALQGAAGAQVLDIKEELDRLYRRYLNEARVQLAAGALAVLGLLALRVRSAARLLALSAPLALATLLALGGLALLDVALGILHLVGLLLVVAVGSNYALFFDHLAHEGRCEGGTDDDTLASLMLANLTTVISFGLIALSDIPSLSAIGRVVAPGALLALLLSAAFASLRAEVPAPAESATSEMAKRAIANPKRNRK